MVFVPCQALWRKAIIADGPDAYLVNLGHKVGGLLCGMPNLTQCEGNDCRGHTMVPE